MHKQLLLGLGVAATLFGALTAGPPAPPPPAEYDVIIRYRIDAARTERIKQFFEMTRYLESIGFKKDPTENEDEPADAAATEMTGTIASANVRKILAERHVRTIMLFAKGTKPPADGKQLVRVDLSLTSGLNPELQQRLYGQTRTALADIGFQEAIGYDHRGHTRIVGNIASKNLLTLLQDLRRTPGGSKMTAPFQGTTPVRLVEVLTGMALVKPRPAQPAAPAGQEKIAPDLRALLSDKEQAASPRRVDVILWLEPSPGDRRWQQDLRQAAPGVLIEGQLGPVVSVLARPDQIGALAAVPTVTGIRSPVAAPSTLEQPGPGKDGIAEAMRQTGLERLHRLGHKGRRTRIAIIDGDFSGWADMVKKGSLPPRTSLVDVTAERSRELMPDAMAGTGHGTRCALAAAQAAPEAELILVRVDPSAPYQVQETARYINGESFTPPSLEERGSELAAERAVLNDRREQLLLDRRVLLGGNLPFEELEPKLADLRARQESFDKDEKAHDQRTRRYLDLLDGLRGLRGVQVVASALTWSAGYPVDGSGPLARYFDDQPFQGALWFQAAGDTSGQAWAGLFRDLDGNGTMEFVAPGTKLPADVWYPELNFLGWKVDPATEHEQLPAGAKVRVTLQWREAHDPDFLKNGEDAFRAPLADLRIVILHQRDIAGTKLPGDDLEVVAQSEKLPIRLSNQASSATYEHAVEFTVPAAGRYAVMIQGQAPTSTRPANMPGLTTAQQIGELRPRVFVETLGGKGRAVLEFTSERGPGAGEAGALGTPADAHAVITVGSANPSGRAAAYSGPGPAFNLELLGKPDVLAYDQVEDARGTSLAASFAAGMAASALSAGTPRTVLIQVIHSRPGSVLRLPTELPRRGH
jgi:hypothetical protein